MAMLQLAQLRREFVAKARRIVVKVGTGVLSSETGAPDTDIVASLARQIALLTDSGRRVALVSSGAIGTGVASLQMKGRPKTLPRLQAAASVGQSKLMGLYDRSLSRYGYHAAQILLTRSDFENRGRYLNACNTIHALFDLRAVPIINENDTISVDEIRFGDNDMLSAFVATMIKADLLILLTMAEGLYDMRRPKARELVPVVEQVGESVLNLATSEKTSGGSGGMRSKLQAVRMVVSSGGPVVIANGKEPDVLLRLAGGEPLGTLFIPARRQVRRHKLWIRFTARPKGRVLVDDGAERILRSRAASLLPVGVSDVQGEFHQGDVVSIADLRGQEIARGLTNFSSDELRRIKGLRSTGIRAALGRQDYNVVVHYDNMVVLGRDRDAGQP